MSNGGHDEGLKAARLLMVLSSILPLFILWAFRGNKLVPDRYLLALCAVMIVLPNLFLLGRIRTARRLHERRELTVGVAEDHREHLLVYLFAMLLPLYTAEVGTWRDASAVLAALAFIVFLFWHLNLHYMNLFFAGGGLPRLHRIAASRRESIERTGESGAHHPPCCRVARRAHRRLPPE